MLKNKNSILKYRFLLQNLISRDLKIKYRRSVLGILWSVLNPLFMMLIMTAVFTSIFRFDIENYPVYLLSGQLLFTFFNESTNAAMASVLQSASLIKKVYMPKYIFPLEKVIFSLVNHIFSTVALILVMLITKAPITPVLPFIILPIFLLFIFNLGAGLFLSSFAIFFRDIMHFWSVFITALTYATPIFYPEDLIIGTLIEPFIKLNPLYWYISSYRGIVLDGTLPSFEAILICCLFSALSLSVGIFAFRKGQDKFILYI